MATSIFLGSPKFQGFDNNGDPLAGGLLWSYVPSTTTLTNTYPTVADALAGTNPNANPVVLNSRGEATVVVSGVVKLILEDAVINPSTGHGVQIWEEPAFSNQSTSNIEVLANSSIRLYNTASTFYTGLKAASGLATSTTFTLPSADGTSSQVLQTNGAGVLSFASSPMPIGSVIAFAGTGSVPSGYLLCDGSDVSRTTYADLFAVISTTWGVGNGTTTFGLPDTRRRSIMGKGGTIINGPSNTVGTEYSSGEVVTLVVANMPAKTAITTGTVSNGTAVSAAGINLPTSTATWTAGTATPFTIVPSVAVMQHIIKY